MRSEYHWSVAPLRRWQSWALWGLMPSPVAHAVWFFYFGPLRCTRRAKREENFN